MMVEKVQNGFQISGANPENEPLTLNIRVNGQPATIALPSGSFAGASATITIYAEPN